MIVCAKIRPVNDVMQAWRGDERTSMSQTTVILTVWKRNHLQEQLLALASQTQAPAEVWIYQCSRHVDVARILSAHARAGRRRGHRVLKIKHIRSDVNLKYFGRFSLAQYCTTGYVWILDDDVIPSACWLETSRRHCDRFDAIISSAGRIIPPRSLYPERIRSRTHLMRFFVGDSSDRATNYCPEHTAVDFGCNSWLFRTDWLRFFWAVYPHTLETGEDLHLSATCSIAAGIKTVVPRQTDTSYCGNLKRAYGFDRLASFRRRDFLAMRAGVIRYLTNEQHWKPLLW